MRFAYRDEFATQPLAAALQRRGWRVIPAERPGELILNNEADIALAPTLEYAQFLGVVDYALVPGLAIMTEGFAGLLRLVFNKGLVSIDTVAVKQPDSSEALVARMVLSEKYEIEPRLVKVPQEAGFQEMIAQADAALLTGDDAIFEASANRSLLDLTDEWEDITETALPYMLAWGRVDEVPQSALDELIEARDEAVLTLADVASRHPKPAEANAFYQRYLLGGIRYTLEERDLAALDAYFRYAFFRLAVQDIPSLKYLPNGEPAMPPPAVQPPDTPPSADPGTSGPDAAGPDAAAPDSTTSPS